MLTKGNICAVGERVSPWGRFRALKQPLLRRGPGAGGAGLPPAPCSGPWAPSQLGDPTSLPGLFPGCWLWQCL